MSSKFSQFDGVAMAHVCQASGLGFVNWSSRICLIVCVAALAGSPVKAQWLGATLSWKYYAYGGPYDNSSMQTAGTFVVDGGIGGTFSGTSNGIDIHYFDIVADENSILFDYSGTNRMGPWALSDLSLPPTIHNGVAIDVLSGPVIQFASVDSTTNMSGFDSSRISYSANQIQLDWQGLSFNTGTMVRINVTTVPEPTCPLSSAVILTLVCVLHRKRQNK